MLSRFAVVSFGVSVLTVLANAQIGNSIDPDRRVDWTLAGSHASSPAIFGEIFPVPPPGSPSENLTNIENAVDDAIAYASANSVDVLVQLDIGEYELESTPELGTSVNPIQNVVVRGYGPDATTLVVKDDSMGVALHVHGWHNNWVSGMGALVGSFSDYDDNTWSLTVTPPPPPHDTMNFDVGDLVVIYFESPSTHTTSCSESCDSNSDYIENYSWHSALINSTNVNRCCYDPSNYFGSTALIASATDHGGNYELLLDRSILESIDIAEDNGLDRADIRVVGISPAVGVGIEDLAILQDIDNFDPSNANQPHGVKISNASNCWLKNVEFKHFVRASTYIYSAGNISITQCGYYDADRRTSGGFGYGVVLGANTSDCLIEDNVFRRMRHSVVLSTGTNKNVISYNFAIDDTLAEFDIHGHYPHSNLFEGNCVGLLYTDDWWGPCGPKNTWFRNFLYDDRMWLQNHETFNLLGNEGRLTMNDPSGFHQAYAADPDLLDLYGYQGEGGAEVNHAGMGLYPRDGDIVLEDISYYLTGRPLFLSSEYTWPPIGPRIDQSSPASTQRIPALDRHLANCEAHPEDCFVDIHLGNGNHFDHQEWTQELIVQILGYASVVKHVKVYLHSINEPWELDFSQLRLDELPDGAPLEQLSILGVGPERMSTEVAFPGEVVVDGQWGSLQLGIGRNVDLTISGITFQHIWNSHTPRSSSHSLIDSKGASVTIEDCRFLDVISDGPSTTHPAGVVSFEASPGLTGSLNFRNCVFADCTGPKAGVAIVDRAMVSIENCTFHRCSSDEGYPQTFLFQNCGSTDIRSSLFTGSADSLKPAFTTENGSTIASYCLFDAQAWAEQEPSIDITSCQIVSSEATDEVVRYLNPAFDVWDFRLKHDSQVLDKGHPESGSDFDLTKADMGWTHTYPVVLLGSTVNVPLDAGFYEVESDYCSISSDIAAGAVIRIPGGKVLRVWACNEPEHCIGSLTGPRTAFVGRTSDAGMPAAGVELVKVMDSSLILNGVLFNFAPQSFTLNGHTASLHIYDSGQPDVFSVAFDHVAFKNYTNVPDPAGGAYDGSLLLRDCVSILEGLAVGTSEGPAQLQLVNSNVRVENCDFIPTTRSILTGEPALKIHGVLAGGETELVDNTFRGLPGSDSDPILLDVTGSTVRMEGNQFLDVRNTALIESNSSLYMDREARNHFLAYMFPDTFETNAPLLAMESGNLDLFCGRNNFVAIGTDWPIIFWQVANPETLQTVSQVWRDNFWGADCAVGLAPLELELLDLIPDWATLETTLDACVTPADPANPLCPFTAYEPYELLSAGKNAEKDGDLALAHVNYTALLHLYPLAKEINDGTLRLKALGLDKIYGPESYESIREDLFMAADSTDAYKLHSLSILQLCSGWCVEARWGDRFGAVDALEDLLALETDPLCRDTINRALLEIATYPPPEGGMMAASSEAQLGRAIQESQAVSALLSYQRGSDLASETSPLLPTQFAITRIYPNPFNPTTMIELALPEEQRVRVRIYNMLGQQVAEVLNDELDAGTHKLIFNGSRYASGVYFALAETREETEVKKMLLLK